MEVAGIRRQVAQGSVEVAEPEVGSGGVAVVDGGRQALEVLPDVAEQGALQRPGLLGGAENPYHRAVGGLPGRGEVPQLATAPEVFESGHPVGVLGPGDRPPVLKLAQLLGEVGGVVPGLRQLGRKLLGPDLHLVALLGRHQHGKDGGVDRGGGLDGPSKDLQLVELLGVEEALVEGWPSACPWC